MLWMKRLSFVAFWFWFFSRFSDFRGGTRAGLQTGLRRTRSVFFGWWASSFLPISSSLRNSEGMMSYPHGRTGGAAGFHTVGLEGGRVALAEFSRHYRQTSGHLLESCLGFRRSRIPL